MVLKQGRIQEKYGSYPRSEISRALPPNLAYPVRSVEKMKYLVQAADKFRSHEREQNKCKYSNVSVYEHLRINLTPDEILGHFASQYTESFWSHYPDILIRTMRYLGLWSISSLIEFNCVTITAECGSVHGGLKISNNLFIRGYIIRNLVTTLGAIL